jgi:hypothetical protein
LLDLPARRNREARTRGVIPTIVGTTTNGQLEGMCGRVPQSSGPLNGVLPSFFWSELARDVGCDLGIITCVPLIKAIDHAGAVVRRQMI